jgi:hypothetical protein
MSSTYIPGLMEPVNSSGRGTRGTLKKDKTKFIPVLPSSSAADGPRRVRHDLTLPINYRLPVFGVGTADRQEQQIETLPLVYRIQNAGDLRNAYWGDPESREIIQAAARVYYRDYPSYSDQWAENFWQKDIMGAALTPGSVPPWQMLQQIFTGQVKAEDDAPTSRSYVSGGGGGYGGGSGGGGGGQVSLTNPTSARGLLMQTMQGVLGRDPTNSEYKSFIKVLNESEMANPQTVSFEGDTAVGSGGVDAGLLALEFAQDQEDFRERQGDQYFRTFMSALAGGV